MCALVDSGLSICNLLYHRASTCNAPPSESPPSNASVTEIAFTAPHGPESRVRRTQIPNCSISSPRACFTSRPRVHSTLLEKHSSSPMTSPSTASSKTLPALCSSRSICPQREESEQHASRGRSPARWAWCSSFERIGYWAAIIDEGGFTQ